MPLHQVLKVNTTHDAWMPHAPIGCHEKGASPLKCTQTRRRSTRCLSSAPQDCHGHEEQTKKLSQTKGE